MLFSKIFFRKMATVFSIAAVFFVLSASNVFALRGNSGWLHTFYNSTSATCGINHYVSTDTYQSATSTPVIVPKIRLVVLRNSDSADITDINTVSGSTVGPTCFNPCTQSRQIDITGDGTYPDWGGIYQMGGCNVLKSKRVHDGVYMKPTASGPDYQALFPNNTFAWLKEDPNFSIELANYPATITGNPGATVTGIDQVVIFDFLGGTVGSAYFQSFTGGTGTYTLSKKGLADGTHVWSFYVFLKTVGGGLYSARTPSHTFGLDTHVPVINSFDYSPVAPGAGDDVTITATSTDPTSGLDSIQIYVDGVLSHTCPMLGETSAQSCTFDAGTFAAGSTHTYAAAAVDQAGNETPLPVAKNFTIAATVTADFDITPPSGNSPLDVTISASNIGGTATGTTSYYYWGDCNSGCATRSDCESACGTATSSLDVSKTFNYALAGEYHPRMVIERQGAYVVGGATVTVGATNLKPEVTNESASINFDYCVDPASSIFSWNYSDPEGKPQSAYRVQAINENETDFSSPSIDSGKVSISTPGSSNSWGTVLPYGHSYRWRVMVWDSDDLGSDWREGNDFLTPIHKYPKADFNFFLAHPVSGEEVQFADTSTSYSADGEIKNWEWTFENGTPETSNEKNPSAVFPKKDSLKVELKVTDSDGFTCSVAKTLSVKRRLPEWKEVSPL
jgi:hypothetical protein